MNTVAPTDDLRPARRTPRLGLPIPGDAGPADYVTATGDLADAMDAAPAFFMPGDLKMTAATDPPAGWLRCDGAAVSRADFAALFAAIGEAYGSGDGATTFNVPNLVGRMPLGADGRAPYGGAEAHTLTIAEMPAHNHPLPGAGQYVLINIPGGTDIPVFGTNAQAGIPGVAFEGGGAAHNNMPPFAVVNYLIKT